MACQSSFSERRLPSIVTHIRGVDEGAQRVKRTSPDTENHEQNGLRKSVYNDKYTFNIIETNVDNDNSDTTYNNMRNM